MSITTKDKLAFALAMGRRTRADVRQVQELLRYAGTLDKLADTDWGRARRSSVQRKVTELCEELKGPSNRQPPCHCGTSLEDHRRMHMNHPFTPIPFVLDCCEAVFDGPRLKIRAPSGVEVEVPS